MGEHKGSLHRRAPEAIISLVGRGYQLLRPRNLKNLVTLFAHGLLPSILLKQANAKSQARKASDTAWLDGLRGLAAIAVFNFHFLFAFGDLPYHGFDRKHQSILRLPVIRLCFDGFAAVAIFFVVSGYVCSLSALRLLHNGNHEKLLNTLSRSVFRRFFRLFLPTACMTLITALGTYIGIFEHLRPMIEQKKVYFPGAWSEPSLQRFPSLFSQLRFWLEESFTLWNIWNTGPQYLHHDPHLWAIAYEFRASMYLYLTILGITPCKPRVRLFVFIASGVLNFAWHRWEGPLFFGGAAIAQVSIMIQSNTTPQLDQVQRQLPNRRSQYQYLRFISCCVALYLMSYPLGGNKVPATGYAWINQFIPSWYNRKDKFPKSIGGLMLVFLLATSEHKAESASPSLLHRLFTCRFAQYMGRNIFAFYLVHGTVLHCFGYAVPHMVWHFTKHDSPLKYGMGLGIGIVVNVAVCAWAAEIFTREIDARCILLTRWMEKVSFMPQQ